LPSITVSTPLGSALFIESNGSAIIFSDFRKAQKNTRSSDPLLHEAAHQVRAYFAHRLERFDLPLRLPTGTPFENAVWKAVTQLRFGVFVSYADIAHAIGHPRSHRGVAAAIKKTPLDLFIPAHRVIGADGLVKGCAANSMRARLAAFEGKEGPHNRRRSGA